MKAFLTLGVLMLVAVGCGGKGNRLDTVRAEGTLSVDDKPYGPVLLILTPTDAAKGIPTVNAYVDANGKFKLQTYEEGDGAVPGSYTVGLTMDPMKPVNPPPIKATTVEIKEGSEPVQLDIKLESTGSAAMPSLGAPGRPLGAPIPGK